MRKCNDIIQPVREENTNGAVMADGEAQFNPSNNNYRMLSEGLVENGQQSGNQEGPSRPLQQQRQVFQARVSGQSITSMVDRADEELDPGRTSMVDMRPRGKKKPFKSEGPVRGVLNLQLPIESSCNSQSSLLFDENKMVSYPATEPALEPRIAPHSSRAKENKVMPEQWANVKMAQNSWCSGSSGEVPHNRPSFQPSMEVDLNPCVVPCKIKPEVNTVLYDHLPAAREEYGPGDEMPRTKEQSMYLKHLLLEGSMEFCFEEVRANCYFARRLQELEEKMQKRSKAKESVLQQIEEKMRLLQQRTATTSGPWS
ncbi:hypothetical protein UPYG_G00276560 [Umbra pygmaea]|uniref:Uncharacterized protein n=1 Tax=Umbra pygmaea TaxID=75934 RepID=A0ABD0WLF1_UMBPY